MFMTKLRTVRVTLKHKLDHMNTRGWYKSLGSFLHTSKLDIRSSNCGSETHYCAGFLSSFCVNETMFSYHENARRVYGCLDWLSCLRPHIGFFVHTHIHDSPDRKKILWCLRHKPRMSARYAAQLQAPAGSLRSRHQWMYAFFLHRFFHSTVASTCTGHIVLDYESHGSL